MQTCFHCRHARLACGDPKAEQWVGCLKFTEVSQARFYGYEGDEVAKGWIYLSVEPGSELDPSAAHVTSPLFLLVEKNAKCLLFEPR